jgi:hypothetical protein
MPGEEAIGKSKIYNLHGNVRSGSHAADSVGKMCKKGRNTGFRFQALYLILKRGLENAGSPKPEIWHHLGG